MKSAELRKGNIVKNNRLDIFNKGYVEIEARNIYELAVFESGQICEDYSKLFEPIPITKEWLLKLGFEEIYKSKHRKVFDFDKDFRFGYNDNFGLSNITSGVTFRGDKFDNIKYVHQLQNFYQSITHEELNIIKQ